MGKRESKLPLILHLQGTLLPKINIRRFATANRLRVSINGQPCTNFPHSSFDHYAKFGCRFSYCASMRSQNFWHAGAPPLWDRGVASPLPVLPCQIWPL